MESQPYSQVQPNQAQGAHGHTSERIPNFLLSAPPTPSAQSTAAPSPSPYTPTNASLFRTAASPPTAVTFNERLRAGGGGAALTTPSRAPPTPTTPARMPPSRSLLDDTGASASMLPVTSRNTPGSVAHTPTTATGSAVGVERWVTVFGFQPTHEAQVLREMRRHGDVVRFEVGRGNWTHIMYGTQVSAQVALYRRWRYLPGNTVMFGIVPCTEPEIAREAERKVESAITSASPSVARRSPMLTSPSPAHRTMRNSSVHTPSSLLRRDPISAASPAAVTPSASVRAPQPQKGIFSYIADLVG